MTKHKNLWQKTRRKWFKENSSEFYTCYLCFRFLLPEETTLDHVIPRSARPDLRYELSNLEPCCWECNYKKGSKH